MKTGFLFFRFSITKKSENETQAEFSERHAEMRRDQKLDEIQRRKDKRKKNGLKPPVVQRRNELWTTVVSRIEKEIVNYH